MIVSVKSTLGAAPSVHMKPRWLPEQVNAQSCSSGKERCVTTLITAAKETINHDDLPKKRGTVNGLKTGVHHKISSRSWSPFAMLFMATKVESENKISVEMVSSTFKRRKPVPISYHQARTVKIHQRRLERGWLQNDE